MFGQKKPSSVQGRTKAERIEAEATDDLERRLVRALSAAKLELPPMPASARRSMQHRLVQRYQWERTPILKMARYAANLVWITTCVLLLYAAMPLMRSGAIPSTLLQLESWLGINQARQTSTLFYERMPVEYKQPLPDWIVPEAVLLETWYTADFSTYRYQVTRKDGSLVYFEQRDGTQWVRTAYSYTMSAPEPRATLELVETEGAPGTLKTSAWTDISWLPASDINTDWPRLRMLLAQHQVGCKDPFCLLGIDSQDPQWQCSATVCERSFPNAVKLVITAHPTRQSEPGEPWIVDIETSGTDESLYYRLQFDKKSGSLIEISTHDVNGAPFMLARPSASQAPAPSSEVLTHFPQPVRKLTKDHHLFPITIVRSHFLSSSLPSNSYIDNPTSVQVGVEYEISNQAEDAFLGVDIASQERGFYTATSISQIPLIELHGIITVNAQIDPSRIDPTSIPSGRAELRVGGMRYDWVFGEEPSALALCIRCDANIPNFSVSGVGNRGVDKVEVWGKTLLRDGEVVCSQLIYGDQIYSEKRPHQCGTTKNGIWSTLIDLTQIPASNEPVDDTQYTLLVYPTGHPENNIIVPIGQMISLHP